MVRGMGSCFLCYRLSHSGRLWLNMDRIQANVMLSYPIDEAESLLQSKHKAAKLSLSNCEEDLDFLREQITVSA